MKMSSRKRLLEADDDVNSSDDETEHQDCASTRTYAKSNRRYCPHCSQYVVLKTYRSHKRLYFSEVSLPINKFSADIDE